MTMAEIKQPKLMDQVKGLAKVAVDTVKTGQLFASDVEAKHRWAICQACPHLTDKMPNRLGLLDGVKRCKCCGCGMETKVKASAAKCAAGTSLCKDTPEPPKW